MQLQKNIEPIIAVGIVSAESVSFTLNTPYTMNGKTMSGTHTARWSDGSIELDGEKHLKIELTPAESKEQATFSLHDVVIGINFHWERTETQTFSGALSFVVDGNKIWAVNKLPIEDYLYSVIASEMSATSSLELLKAHAVTSRSWLIAQLQRKNDKSRIEYRTDNELVKWYDRDDHHLFDVCADDHCQRYQGITRIKAAEQTDTTLLGKAHDKLKQYTHSAKSKSPVRQAIDETRGMLLISKAPGQSDDGEVCDARFSKCCGGMTEQYDTCWDETPHRYLQAFPDFTIKPEGYDINLREEEHARRWITSSPESFCNTQDAKVLKQVLNSYDQETSDFYRWEVSYTTEELSELVKRRTGIDFGTITDLIPVTRGASGRISRLKITGTKKTFIIGKELEIRRSLSESHLYSSAFIVEKTDTGFTLTGSGWGHGVGLCQIGAAVMSERGFGYKAILLHYFRCALVEKWW